MRKQYNKEAHMDYRHYIESLYGEDNSASHRRLILNMRAAIASELTARQMELIRLYYLEGMTMEQAGRKLGIEKSTVSRTLLRGRARLKRCIKYGAVETLKEELDN